MTTVHAAFYDEVHPHGKGASAVMGRGIKNKERGEFIVGNAKKIAVIVRDRKEEALRMAVGLTLADDEVSVFVMDGVLGPGDSIDVNIETLKEMGGRLLTNNPANPFEQTTTEEMASALAGFDVVVAY